MIDPREDLLRVFKDLLKEHLDTYPKTLFDSGFPVEGVASILKSHLPTLVDMALEDVLAAKGE